MYLALSEDVNAQYERPLFQSKLFDIDFRIKSLDQEDDAGAYILKRLGFWKKADIHKELDAFLRVQMDYFNHRSQAYEPLLEPWSL